MEGFGVALLYLVVLMFKRFSVYLGSSVTASLLTFSLSVFASRSLPPEGFGLVGLFFAGLFFIRPFVSFNSISLVSINKVNLNKQEYQQFINTFFTVQILIACLVSLVFLCYVLFWGGSEYYLIAAVFLSFVAMNDVSNAELIISGQYKRYAIYLLLTKALTMIFAVVFISFFNFGWAGVMFGVVLSELIVLCCRLFWGSESLLQYRPCISAENVREILKFGAPLILALFFGWALNQSDKFIVLKYFSLSEVGHYTAAYSIGVVINTINQSATNTFIPRVYDALKSGAGGRLLLKYSCSYVAFFIFLLVGMWITVPIVVPLFFGEGYRESIPIVYLIAIAFGFSGLYRITGFAIEYYKKNIVKTFLIGGSAVINVFLSVYLIEEYGVLAPAIGTVCGYVFLAAASQIMGNILIARGGEWLGK